MKARTASISDDLARRRRARLDDHGQRLVELARDGRQVADELVRLLADDAAALEVGEDAVEQLRVAQQLERRLASPRRRASTVFVLRLEGLPDLLLLQLLELQQHLAEVAA